MTSLTSAQFFNEVQPLNLYELIDPNSPEWREAAHLMQGNIAKSHGRDYSVLMLIDVGSQPDRRRRLKDLALRYVTSAKEQDKQGEEYRKKKKSDVTDKQLFGSLYLSVWGYQALGYSASQLNNAFPDPEGVGASNWFLTGMQYQGAALADPPCLEWESQYRDNRLDAILLLACDDAAVLSNAVADAEAEIASFGRIIQIERGITLRDAKSRAIEHFGFVDGITHPGVFRSSSPSVLPRHLLVPDVLAKEENAFGSYLVYRKLEQDVKGFDTSVAQLADAASVSPEYAAAMVMGRFKDGTPLTHSTSPENQPIADIDFRGDLNGSKCPFHSHVRKVNPRVNPKGRTIKNPLFRRGVPYGSYIRDFRQTSPSEGVGLLFMSFQADIGRQFGMITREWVNAPNFLKEGVGTDTLFGTKQSNAQQWPGSPGGGKDAAFNIGRFVTLKGGEFFFAPSLAFFRNII